MNFDTGLLFESDILFKNDLSKSYEVLTLVMSSLIGNILFKYQKSPTQTNRKENTSFSEIHY